MKKALISGSKICQVADAIFPVHPSLQWVDVPDDTTERDTFENGAVVKHVPPVEPAPIDQSDIDNLEKQMKALALCIAQVGGLTVPQMKTLFKNKMDLLP